MSDCCGCSVAPSSAFSVVPLRPLKTIPRHHRPVREVTSLFSHLRAQNWEKAGAASRALCQSAHGEALRLLSEMKESSEGWQAVQRNTGDMSAMLPNLLKKKEFKAQLALVTKYMLKGKAKVSKETKANMLRAYIFLSRPELMTRLAGIMEKTPHAFGSVREWEGPLNQAILGYYGALISDFHRQHTQSFHYGRKEIEAVAAECKAIRQEVEHAWVKIQQGFLTHQAAVLEEQALKMMMEAERRLPRLASLMAYGERGLSQARKKKRANTEAILGGLSLTIAQTAREMMQYYLLSFYVLAIVSTGKHSRYFLAESKRAGALPFTSGIAWRKLTPLAALRKQPGKYQEKMVTVQGVIDGLHTYQESLGGRRKKLNSAFFVKEGDAHIEAVLPYSNLPARGFADGAYVRLTGVFYKPEGKGADWKIRLDQLAFSQLSKKSWKDAMTATLNRHFAVWPERLHCLSGYAPSTKQRVGTGIHELMRIGRFVPMALSK